LIKNKCDVNFQNQLLFIIEMNKPSKLSSILLYFMSLGCVIHCLFLPYLIVLLPIFKNTLFEFVFLLISFASGFIIIFNGFKKHRKVQSVILYSLGVGVLLLHYLAEYYQLVAAEFYLYCGAIIIIFTYYFNYRLLKSLPNH